MVFAIIPLVFTLKWILAIRKLEIDKKHKRWFAVSSLAGLIMTFNVVFLNLYML